jgi:sugar phosphate isomerase/epimerase
MPTDIKGPAIFLAQFAGDAAPFNSWDAITKWAASLGYKGVQIPSWDGRLFDLKKAADSKTYCDEVKGVARRQWRRDHRALDPSPGPARGRAPGL